MLSSNHQADSIFLIRGNSNINEFITSQSHSKLLHELEILQEGQSKDGITLQLKEKAISFEDRSLVQGVLKRIDNDHFLLMFCKSHDLTIRSNGSQTSEAENGSDWESEYEEIKAMVHALRNLFQAYPQNIFQVDRHGRYTIIKDDDGLLLQSGNKRTGQFWNDIRSGLVDELLSLVKLSKEKQKVVSEEIIISMNLETPTWLRLSALYGHYYTFITYSDISESKKRLEKLVRDERLSTVGVLAGGIAHQYNNLHHAILGQIHIALKESGLKQKKALYSAATILEQGSTLSQSLLSQLRDSSSEFQKMEAHEMFDRIKLLVRDELIRLKCGIKFELERGMLICDPTSFDQVIVNLILNGAHACFATDRDGLIEVKGKMIPSRNQYEIRIVDNGIGIEPNNFNKLFTPLFSTKGVYAKKNDPLAKIKGTGLGLSLARQLLSEYGGSISLDSSSPKGSSFIVKIPASTEKPSDNNHSLITQIPAKPCLSKCDRKIYIADDSWENRNIIKVYLEGYYKEVIEKSNGNVDEEELLEFNPDLIFVDWLMPDYSGNDFLKTLSEKENLRHFLDKTVIISGLDASPEIESWKGKLRKVLRKPVSQEKLLETLEALEKD